MTTSLYQQLGGANGIARLVDDVIAAHLTNPIVKTRFENIKDLDHAKEMARQFFCAGSGGPETYTGRDMLTAHKGMNISEQEYLAVVDDIIGAMEKHGLSQDTKKDVIAILYSLKGEIIRVQIAELLQSRPTTASADRQCRRLKQEARPHRGKLICPRACFRSLVATQAPGVSPEWK